MNIIINNSMIERFEFNPKVVKFQDDNFAYEDDKYKVICEGVVYNSLDLLREGNKESLCKLVIDLFCDGGISVLVNRLHGCYTIALYDKREDILYIANDLLSKKPVYYVSEKGKAVVSTSFLDCVDGARILGIKLSVNEFGVKEMTANGVFTLSNTYYEQIKFIEHMEYLIIKGGVVEPSKIEYIHKKDDFTDMNEAISYIDSLFRNSCRQAAEKNSKAGYLPAFSLSAGMDSRCSFLAGVNYSKEYSGKVPFCFSYGISGCNDLKIASQIADIYNCDFQAANINKENYLLDRDEILSVNEGQMNYSGTTGLRRLINRIDTSNMGIVFTGIGGGECMGDLRHPNGERSDWLKLLRKSYEDLCPNEEIDQVCDRVMKEYSSYNEFVGFQDIRTCLNFHFSSRDKFEFFSPYLDEDFFMTMINLPYEWVGKRRLYTEWYMKKFDLDLPTTYEYFQGKIRKYKLNPVFRYLVSFKHLFFGTGKSWIMNPTNEELTDINLINTTLGELFDDDIAKIKNHDSQVENMLIDIYLSTKGNMNRRLHVLTVSGTLSKMYSK